MERGLGLGTGTWGWGYGGFLGQGIGRTWTGGDGLGANLAKSSVCPISLEPEHTVYLHISVQYIKYSLLFFLSKKYFFFLFSFF